MIAILPLLLAATPVAGDSASVTRPAARGASASVTIIQPERITPALVKAASGKPDRQVRQRETATLVEFF
jgi:hypothetical protein